MVDPYKSLYRSSRKEIDLRQELKEIFFGSEVEIEKGRKGLLRKMRRDSDGNLINCVCRDKITKDPDRDYHCRFCKGWGYYWDEYEVTYFRNDASYSKASGQNNEYAKDYFYLQHTVDITSDDYLIILNNDTEGDIVVPTERFKYFKIFSADAFRSDYGRIEYWRIRAHEERRWSVWYE